jgi:4-amino-4-deoxy-L-arabinose transferase-like glycosyltransferase
VAALELVNAVVSAAALPFGWSLARRWGGRRAAWWMLVLLFSSPLLWFYASQPLSYGTELGWAMAIACCAWFVAEGDQRSLVPLALLMATAGGIRPNTPLFLLPLVLVCCVKGIRQGIKPWRLLVTVALGLGVLVWWLQAFLEEAGGLAMFWAQLMAWKGDHSQQASGGGVFGNGWLLIRTVALTAPAGLGLALWTWRSSPGGPAAAGELPREQRLWRRWFLLLWMVPSASYLLAVHFTRMGHATTLLPALLLLLAMHLAQRSDAVTALPWPRPLVLVLVLQCALFLFVPGDRFLENLRSYDHEWGTAIRVVQGFDPATTLVVVSGRSNRRAYRLPSVHLPAYDHGEADLVLDQRDDTIDVHPPLQRVVLIDRGLAVTPADVPGGRFELLIPGRLQLIDVPVPPSGLRVSRRQVKPLPPATESAGTSAQTP